MTKHYIRVIIKLRISEESRINRRVDLDHKRSQVSKRLVLDGSQGTNSGVVALTVKRVRYQRGLMGVKVLHGENNALTAKRVKCQRGWYLMGVKRQQESCCIDHKKSQVSKRLVLDGSQSVTWRE